MLPTRIVRLKRAVTQGESVTFARSGCLFNPKNFQIPILNQPTRVVKIDVYYTTRPFKGRCRGGRASAQGGSVTFARSGSMACKGNTLGFHAPELNQSTRVVKIDVHYTIRPLKRLNDPSVAGGARVLAGRQRHVRALRLLSLHQGVLLNGRIV